MQPFITKEEITKMVQSLARQIEADYDNREIILICPLRGSVHMTADLGRELHMPVQVDFVQLQV